LSYALVAHGQRVVHNQSLYWIRYHNHLIFSPSFYWSNEIDNRRFFSPSVQNQLIFHSRIHFKKKKWEFGTGLTLSWIYAQKPELGYDHAVNEIRAITEALHEFPLRKIYFQNRLRVDYRFFQESPDQNVFEESFFVMRFRYRAQVRIPLKVNDQNESLINVRIADEIMFNDRENTFDQNRINVSADFYISRKITLEAGYIYIYQQRFGENEFFERHVARFTFLHKIALH